MCGRSVSARRPKAGSVAELQIAKSRNDPPPSAGRRRFVSATAAAAADAEASATAASIATATSAATAAAAMPRSQVFAGGVGEKKSGAAQSCSSGRGGRRREDR